LLKPLGEYLGRQQIDLPRFGSPTGTSPRSRPSVAALSLLASQNPHHRKDCVPVACSRRHTEQLVDPAKISNRLHVATIHSVDESLLRGDHSYEPLSVGRKCDRQASPEASGSRQNAHESNDIGAWRFTSKRILEHQTEKIATVAEDNFRLEWKLPLQFGTEFCARSRLPDDERSSCAYVDDIVIP